MKLKEQIKDRGYRLGWIAKKLEIHQSLLSMYLNNVRPMPEAIERKIKEIIA